MKIKRTITLLILASAISANCNIYISNSEKKSSVTKIVHESTQKNNELALKVSNRVN